MRAFGGIDIEFVTAQGYLETVADAGCAALVVGMGVGEHDAGDVAVAELELHEGPGPAGGGIDDEALAVTLDEIGVEGTGPEEAELEDAGGDGAHGCSTGDESQGETRWGGAEAAGRWGVKSQLVKSLRR